jgi:hypothetical protein
VEVLYNFDDGRQAKWYPGTIAHMAREKQDSVQSTDGAPAVALAPAPALAPLHERYLLHIYYDDEEEPPENVLYPDPEAGVRLLRRGASVGGGAKSRRSSGGGSGVRSYWRRSGRQRVHLRGTGAEENGFTMEMVLRRNVDKPALSMYITARAETLDGKTVCIVYVLCVLCV